MLSGGQDEQFAENEKAAHQTVVPGLDGAQESSGFGAEDWVVLVGVDPDVGVEVDEHSGGGNVRVTFSADEGDGSAVLLVVRLLGETQFVEERPPSFVGEAVGIALRGRGDGCAGHVVSTWILAQHEK